MDDPVLLEEQAAVWAPLLHLPEETVEGGAFSHACRHLLMVYYFSPKVAFFFLVKIWAGDKCDNVPTAIL